jgi:hypothetical protein
MLAAASGVACMGPGGCPRIHVLACMSRGGETAEKGQGKDPEKAGKGQGKGTERAD